MGTFWDICEINSWPSPNNHTQMLHVHNKNIHIILKSNSVLISQYLQRVYFLRWFYHVKHSFVQVTFFKIAHTKGNIFLTAIVNLYKKIDTIQSALVLNKYHFIVQKLIILHRILQYIGLWFGGWYNFCCLSPWSDRWRRNSMDRTLESSPDLGGYFCWGSEEEPWLPIDPWRKKITHLLYYKCTGTLSK